LRKYLLKFGLNWEQARAGSCTLVLQTVWPALMLAGATSRLTLGGGTHNPMAPPFHFLERCYAPLLRRLLRNRPMPK
jgi:RNA 3'-terminal phosphate cyclase (ATP)